MEIAFYLERSEKNLKGLIRENQKILAEIESDPDGFHDDEAYFARDEIRIAEKILAMPQAQRNELRELARRFDDEMKQKMQVLSEIRAEFEAKVREFGL